MGTIADSHALVLLFFFQAEDGIRDWSVTGVQTCALPICRLQVPGEVRQLLELRGEHRRLDEVLLADAGRAPCAARGEEAVPIVPARGLPADHLALPDEARGELRGAAVLTARAAQDQRVAALLDERLRLAAAVGARDLRN